MVYMIAVWTIYLFHACPATSCRVPFFYHGTTLYCKGPISVPSFCFIVLVVDKIAPKQWYNCSSCPCLRQWSSGADNNLFVSYQHTTSGNNPTWSLWGEWVSSQWRWLSVKKGDVDCHWNCVSRFPVRSESSWVRFCFTNCEWAMVPYEELAIVLTEHFVLQPLIGRHKKWSPTSFDLDNNRNNPLTNV